MPNKTEEYLALACKTADSFSRQWEHWAEFLITAARLYKYSYPDQLMIYLSKLPMDCYGDGEPQQTHQTGFGRSKKAWEKCTVTG